MRPSAPDDGLLPCLNGQKMPQVVQLIGWLVCSVLVFYRKILTVLFCFSKEDLNSISKW